MFSRATIRLGTGPHSSTVYNIHLIKQEGQHPLTGQRADKFQATGKPVSRTQTSDAMTSRLPRYEAKCVQRRCFQWESVPLHSDIKERTELPPANILISLERQLIALQLCPYSFYIMKLCSRLFVLYCRNCPKDDKFR